MSIADTPTHVDLHVMRLPHKEPVHMHQYGATCSDLVIVRLCITCGKTWQVTRPSAKVPFPETWQEIADERA